MPGYLYWTSQLLWLFPWTLFIPLGITALWRRQQHQTTVLTHSYSPRTVLPLLAGAAVITSFLSMMAGHRIAFTTVLAAVLLINAGNVLTQRKLAGLTPSPFHRIDPQQRTILLLALFAATVLLFFSLSTNQEYYTFPAYLPLLLLIAATITRAEQTYSTNPSAVRWVTFAHTAFLVLGWTAATALLYGLIASAHLPYNPDLGTVLAHRGVGSYTLATSHFFDLTTAAFAGLRLPAILAALAFLFGPAAAWALRTQRRHLAATTTIAFTAAAFLVAAHIAFARFAPILSSQSFVPVIQQHNCDFGCSDSKTPIAIYGDQAFGSSIPFYLGNPVFLVDGRTTSMLFGGSFPDRETGAFLTKNDLLKEWSSSRPILLFVPAERRDEALHLLPPNPIILKEESGKLLLTNHPLSP